MPVSKAEMGATKPAEYQEGARRARAARENVAEQLRASIEASDLTGSHPFVGRRIGDYARALQSGDDMVIRGALMELGTAIGATVAAIDLAAPPATT